MLELPLTHSLTLAKLLTYLFALSGSERSLADAGEKEFFSPSCLISINRNETRSAICAMCSVGLSKSLF
jgi:hypothetical protein